MSIQKQKFTTPINENISLRITENQQWVPKHLSHFATAVIKC